MASAWPKTILLPLRGLLSQPQVEGLAHLLVVGTLFPTCPTVVVQVEPSMVPGTKEVGKDHSSLPQLA